MHSIDSTVTLIMLCRVRPSFHSDRSMLQTTAPPRLLANTDAAQYCQQDSTQLSGILPHCRHCPTIMAWLARLPQDILGAGKFSTCLPTPDGLPLTLLHVTLLLPLT